LWVTAASGWSPPFSKEAYDWLRASLTRFGALRLSRNSHPADHPTLRQQHPSGDWLFLPFHQPLPPPTIRKLCQLIWGPHLAGIWQSKHLAERVLVAFEWPCGRIQRPYTGQISIAMAPRSRLNGNDTDVSMADAPEPDHRPGEDMVCCSFREETTRDQFPLLHDYADLCTGRGRDARLHRLGHEPKYDSE